MHCDKYLMSVTEFREEVSLHKLKVCLTAVRSGGCYRDLNVQSKRFVRSRLVGEFCKSQGCGERDGQDAAVTKCLVQVGSSLLVKPQHMQRAMCGVESRNLRNWEQHQLAGSWTCDGLLQVLCSVKHPLWGPACVWRQHERAMLVLFMYGSQQGFM